MAEPRFQLFTSLRFDPALANADQANLKGPAGWNRSRPSSPLYMLDLHRDRMLRAARHWAWDAAVAAIDGEEGLSRLEAFILGLPGVADSKQPLRVKVTLSRGGEFGHELSAVPPRPLANLFPAVLPPPGSGAVATAGEELLGEPKLEPESAFTVVPDITGTLRSEYTHYKTTQRPMYDTARERLNITPADNREVLLLNEKDGTVMEGSTTTPYFFRNGRWVTPPVAPKFSNEVGSGGQDGTSRRWSLERGLCVEEAVHSSSLVDGEECWLSNGVRGFRLCKIKLPQS